MLFSVKMDVPIPTNMDPALKVNTPGRGKAYSQELQKPGVWPRIWRCVGQYTGLSILDLNDIGQLHDILWHLPLFEYRTIEVTPLAVHNSDVARLPVAGVHE